MAKGKSGMNAQEPQSVVATVATVAAGAAQVMKRTLRDWALHTVRSISKHNNDVTMAFLTQPAPFFAPEAKLTTAQLCNLFNNAMARVGVGLVMPTDAQGEKTFDREVYERGIALAQGRTFSPNPWVAQSYQPLRGLGRTPRSFYTALTEAARTGLLSDVDPAQFAGLEGDALRDALGKWFRAAVGDGKTPGTLTGSKDKPGPLAYSYHSVAIREGLPPQKTRKRGKKGSVTTAESLLKEYE